MKAVTTPKLDGESGRAGPVADDVADTPAVLAGGRLYKRLGDIDGNHVGASVDEQQGVVSLADRGTIDHRSAGVARKRPGCHQVSVDVETGLRQLDPR
jgi:hypothetical protein